MTLFELGMEEHLESKNSNKPNSQISSSASLARFLYGASQAAVRRTQPEAPVPLIPQPQYSLDSSMFPAEPEFCGDIGAFEFVLACKIFLVPEPITMNVIHRTRLLLTFRHASIVGEIFLSSVEGLSL